MVEFSCLLNGLWRKTSIHNTLFCLLIWAMWDKYGWFLRLLIQCLLYAGLCSILTQSLFQRTAFVERPPLFRGRHCDELFSTSNNLAKFLLWMNVCMRYWTMIICTLGLTRPKGLSVGHVSWESSVRVLRYTRTQSYLCILLHCVNRWYASQWFD